MRKKLWVRFIYFGFAIKDKLSQTRSPIGAAPNGKRSQPSYLFGGADLLKRSNVFNRKITQMIYSSIPRKEQSNKEQSIAGRLDDGGRMFVYLLAGGAAGIGCKSTPLEATTKPESIRSTSTQRWCLTVG